MKKIVLNISDSTFEKLRFEAIHEKKSIREVIEARLLEKPFHEEVESAFSDFFDTEFNKLLKENT